MFVYYNGSVILKENVSISPDDRGFLYADGVYELIRSYRGKLFRMPDHMNRLNRSLNETGIRFESDKISDIAHKILSVNDLNEKDAAVYIQITRGAAPRQHDFPDASVQPTVYISASLIHPSDDLCVQGVKIILTPDIRWARCDIKTINLLPNVLAAQQAKENQAYEAVFVRNQIVIEGSRSNFFAVFSGAVHTHPECPYMLSGITRKVVLEICRKINIAVREVPISENDLKKATELFVSGTTAEIIPVVQVNDMTVKDGKPGELTKKIQKAFQRKVSE